MADIRANILELGPDGSGNDYYAIVGVEGLFYADEDGVLYPRPHPGHCQTCTCDYPPKTSLNFDGDLNK